MTLAYISLLLTVHHRQVGEGAVSQGKNDDVASAVMQREQVGIETPHISALDGVGGMAVPLEKVSPRTFMPRHDCPPGHWCLGMNVPSRHYCPPMPDIFP